jgi:hypothetical protein
MNLDKLYDITAEAVNENELRADEIPNIDLYVDQIINLVSDKTKCSASRYQDRQLTKTMINNYSKDGVITPVNGKKYNKEQIVQILTVYSLKNTLSIGEIKRLLDGAYSIPEYDGKALIDTYNGYIDIKSRNKEYTKDIVRELVQRNELNVDDDKDYILTACALLSLSSFLRNTAQAMIDEKYPAPDETAEKPKKKDAPKEKKKKKEKGSDESSQ